MTEGRVRLRQVAVAALHGAEVAGQLRHAFGLGPAHHDPGVAVFGLENSVFPLGDQFLELICPTTDTAPAARFLARQGRPGAGYMVILEVDAVAPYRSRVASLGLRAVLDSDSATWATLHLHPGDMGVILSVDHDKGGDWSAAGPDWRLRSGDRAVTGIAAVRVATADPTATAARWASFLDLPLSAPTRLPLSEGVVEFVPTTSGRDGLVGVDLLTAASSRIGERRELAGTEFLLVGPGDRRPDGPQ